MLSLRFLLILCAGVALVGVLRSQPVDRSELQALRAQVQQLEAQLKALSAQLEQKEQAAAAAEQKTEPRRGRVEVTDRSYSIKSEDAANSIRLRGLLQLDARMFLDDDPALVNDMFVLRRARVITEGVLARNFSYLFTTEFGGSSVSMLDAAVTFRVSDALRFKAGKYKTPIGLEVLQSDAATAFSERSILAGMLPNRDLGVQVGGALLNQRIDYAVGVFNGVADGANSTNADVDEDRHFVGRFLFTPFRHDSTSPLRGLLFGIAGGSGKQRGTNGRTSGYRTDGQQTFFSYLPTVAAAGETWRVSPQFEYRLGSFGMMGEYVVSNAELQSAPNGLRTSLRHDGWQLTMGYVLTGEKSTYGQVVPRTNFDPAKGTWGAFELVGRIAEADMDDAAFTRFASPTASATEVRSYAIALKWFLSKAVVLNFNYYHTDFGLSGSVPFAVPAPFLRNDEKAFVSRVQLAF